MAKPRGFYKELVAAYFNNDFGEPFELSDGQADIFRLIYEPEYRRVGIKTTTQYGKSTVAAMALVKLATQEKKKRERILKQLGLFLQHT